MQEEADMTPEDMFGTVGIILGIAIVGSIIWWIYTDLTS